jgi:HEAT repeat protein
VKQDKHLRSLAIAVAIVAAILAAATTKADQGNDRLTPVQREIERQRLRLSSLEVEDRRDALMRLGNLKRPDASRAAAAGLRDAVPVVRVTAMHAVLWLPTREAVALVIPLLSDKAEFVRREAASALGRTRDRSAAPALINALADKKASVRGASAIALGELGDDSAVQPLSNLLTGAKKKRSFEDEFVLRAAARSLGQIANRAAVPALIATLENQASAPDTRREAAIALGAIGDAAAIPALQAAFSSGEDPYLTEAARLAMRAIKSKN